MMSWFNNLSLKAEPKNDTVTGRATTAGYDDGIFKAYIPNFLYKPPYGMPRRVPINTFKKLAKNPYVFSVIKTLADEATTIGWEIKVKEEFNGTNESKEEEDTEEVNDTNPSEEKAMEGKDYEKNIKEVTKFFKNPNGNEESFEHIMRQLITDICELDSAVLVKIFNNKGEFKQMVARDGGTFLKNPDIYGYMGNREDFVAPLPDGFTGVGIDVSYGGTIAVTQQQMMRQYDLLFRDNAAYFQYGWTAGSMPVPFGMREIVYIMQNPRGDSIYGRSPIEILNTIILNLIYGADFNLDYYTNNNMPEGVISLMGAEKEHIEQFRENFESNFKFTDDFGNKRKKFFSFPITSTEVKFTPFQLTSQDMEVLEQQKWFTKILWMCFGVTADEMGFSEDSNKAIAGEQAKIFKRKAIKPLLSIIQYHINTQIMPEFFATGSEAPDFADIPLEFVFDTFDVDEEAKNLNLLQQQINMGVKTPEMVAEELGINIEELKKQKEESMKMEMENQNKFGGEENDNNFGNNNSKNPKKDDKGIEKPKDKPPKKKEQPVAKAKEIKPNPMKEVKEYIDNVEDALIQAIDDIDENAR